MKIKFSSSRRALLIGASAWLALARVDLGRAQPQARVYRIGILASDSLETRGPLVEIFIRAMREYGYVQGKNIVFEPRYANGDIARLSELANELVGRNLDVIVVPNSVAVLAVARAAEQAKRAVPIVAAAWGNPLASGLVASLARPGGNVTGLSNIATELAGKQLQLLKEAIPKISRIAVFVDSTSKTAAATADEVERAAKALGMQVLSVELRSGGDVEQVEGAMRKWRADAMFVLNNPINFNSRKLLVQIAEKNRLPAIYGTDSYTDAGGLISYGSDDKFRWRQSATFVDKILKGTKPGDIPVELPTKFELVINMKTAKALGITIPQSLLVRADRVIE